MKTTIFLLLPFLLLVSCRKDDNSSTTNQFQKTDYPVAVGNWWRFQVIDAISKHTDTLTLIVVSKATNSTQTDYNCEVIQNGVLIDTSTYIFSDSHIEYKGKKADYSYLGNFYLSIPFKKGDKWNGVSFNQDTITASDKITSMSILGKQYSNVYSINRNFSALGGYRLNQLIFIVPKIGVIYQSFDLLDGGFVQKQTFQLIDYELK